MQGWSRVGMFENMYQAMFNKKVLEENEIEAVILNEKDSTFLVGDIELYVKDELVDAANVILEGIKDEPEKNSKEE